MPDIDPATMAHTLFTYTVHGDTRRTGFWHPANEVAANGDLTGTADDLGFAFKNLNGVDSTVIQTYSVMPDKSIRSSNKYNGGGDGGGAFQMSPLAWHIVCKDSQNRNCGPYLHLVRDDNAFFQQYAIGSGNAGANENDLGAFVTAYLAAAYTKHGHRVVSFVHYRIIMRRNRNTGGKGRGLTRKRALAYLAKHPAPA